MSSCNYMVTVDKRSTTPTGPNTDVCLGKEVYHDIIDKHEGKSWSNEAVTYLPRKAAKSSLITTNNTTLGTQAGT